MKRIPINTTADGLSGALYFGYYKSGACTLIGGGYGAAGVAVMEICDEERFDTLGDVVGHINSSQDGAICHFGSIVPCLTSGHGNCPKVIVYEDVPSASGD